MMGSAAVASCSFGGLEVGHGLQRVDLVPACKGEKGLLARRAMRQIGLQDALDRARRLLRGNVTIELAAKDRVRSETAANKNVIALDGIGVLVRLDLAGQQADLRYKVLRAGVMAAGQMDVHRRVEGDTRLAPARDLLGVALGVGGRELTAGIAGTGEQACAEGVGFDGETERFDLLLGRR